MTRSDNPYRHLPPKAFWRRAVAGLPMAEVDPVGRFDLKITPKMRVATAGSCFAQHIARHLAETGFNYFVAEPGHPIIPQELRRKHNYGVFSARYGNIYTARQLVQLFDRAYGRFHPAELPWIDDDHSVRDPFRPAIQPGNFISVAEMEADRRQHLATVRQMLETLDVFVFTMGLTECWVSREDGAVFPVCPGVEGGAFDPDRFVFHNQTLDEVVDDMEAALARLKAVNPSASVILTVSPVPLAATAAPDAHVLSATTYSKSVLRVAAQTLTDRHAHVHYFPSFEVITGAYSRGTYYADDLRNVVEDGVGHVMRLFLHHATDLQRAAPDRRPTASEEEKANEAFLRDNAEFVAVECEEAFLNAFANDAKEPDTADQRQEAQAPNGGGKDMRQTAAQRSPVAEALEGAVRRISFGGEAPGFEFVGAQTAFADSSGVGWIEGSARRDVVRPNEVEQVRKSFVLGRQRSVFRLRLGKGRHALLLQFGDAKAVPRAAQVSVTGGKESSFVKSKTFSSLKLVAETDDGLVDLAIEDQPEEGEGWAIVSLETLGHTDRFIEPAPVQERQSDDLWALPKETQNGPRALLEKWRAQKARVGSPQATGLAACDYLRLISGCVDFFRACQDDRGAIIDPYLRVEVQYATPCYAYASALLAAHEGRTDLIESSFKAYAFAAAALGSRTAADGHEDFYPSPLAHARALLANCVAPEKLALASEPLRRFDPYRVYRKPPGGRKRSGANWNCKALAGHWLLIEQGLQKDNGYVSQSLLRQGRWFDNENGLYAEGPATYDAFPRAWLADMLAHGYDGPCREVLCEALERGAISSLFMQSPTGELATGGRSSHHQWADALQCVIFEWAASQAVAKEAPSLAATFKRAARRVIRALQLWRRPSGEFWIVKNRMDPELRHGYEPYSHQSQYNLLTATALGFAFELAQPTEWLDEDWSPAEVGRYVFVAGQGMDRVFATADGTQVEAALAPVPNQTPRGLLRIHMKSLPPQLPITDGAPDTPMFGLVGPQPPAIALGLAWEPTGSIKPGARRIIDSVASLPIDSAQTIIRRFANTIDGAFLCLRHKILVADAPRFIDESAEIEAGAVTVTWNWDPEWNKGVTLRFPIFASDGATSSKMRMVEDGSTLSVEWRGMQCRFSRVGPGEPIRIGRELWPFRCGWYRIAELPAAGAALTLHVSGNVDQGAATA